MMAATEKTKVTKEKLKSAFLKLYSEKSIDKISIKEIADKAGVNRGTFYAHYLDIYDLREKAEAEAAEILKTKVLPIIESLITNRQLNESLLPDKLFFEESGIGELFFGKAADIRAVNKLKGIMKESLSDLMGLDKKKEDVKIKYTMEYLVSAQASLIGMWLRNHMEIPVTELGRIIEEINLRGAVTYLQDLTVEHKKE